MKRNWTVADIRFAIEAHRDAGNLVDNPDELATRIATALGLVEELEYRGWHLRRKPAAAFGLEGDFYGWEATNAQTRTVRQFPPRGKDVSLQAVKKALDRGNAGRR